MEFGGFGERELQFDEDEVVLNINPEDYEDFPGEYRGIQNPFANLSRDDIVDADAAALARELRSKVVKATLTNIHDGEQPAVHLNDLKAIGNTTLQLWDLGFGGKILNFHILDNLQNKYIFYHTLLRQTIYTK